MIKLIIADNSSIFCEGLRTVLGEEDHIKLVACTKDLKELEKLTTLHQPDVVLLDYSVEYFGEHGVKEFKQKHKGVKLIAITGKQDREKILHALQSGLSSYLLKDCSIDEIIEAVHETANGKQFFCGNVFDLIKKTEEEEEDCSGVALSKREIEVIQLIAEGFTNKEIAEQLYLSNHTVNTHRKNIMHKLGIRNTAGIVIYAVKEKIINT